MERIDLLTFWFLMIFGALAFAAPVR